MHGKLEDIQTNPEANRRDDAIEPQLTRLGILAGQSLQSFKSSSPEGSLQRVSAGGLSRLSPQFSTVLFCLGEIHGIQLHLVVSMSDSSELNRTRLYDVCNALQRDTWVYICLCVYSRLATSTISETEFTQSRKGRRFGRINAQMALPNHSCKRRARHG